MAKIFTHEELRRLLERSRAGDLGARGELLTWVQERCRRLARWLLKRHFADVRKYTITSEALQVLSIKLLKNMEKAWEIWEQDPKNFDAYVHKCLRRLLIDMRRSIFGDTKTGVTRPRTETNQDFEMGQVRDVSFDDAQHPVEATDWFDEIRRHLGRIDQLLLDYMRGGVCDEEIAEHLRVSVLTVRRRRWTLLKRLQELAATKGGI